MSITKDEVRHIAKLARLKLPDAEVDKFTKELSSIIDYVGELQEVDTITVEPTAQITGLSNSFRADEVKPSETDADSLLNVSPLQKVEHQIETHSAHG